MGSIVKLPRFVHNVSISVIAAVILLIASGTVAFAAYAASAQSVDFRVLVINTSPAVRLSPGVWTVHQGNSPLLTEAALDHDGGLARLAESGDTSSLTASLARTLPAGKWGTFNTPLTATELASRFSGQVYEFTFEATPGDHLSFATSFEGATNRLYAPSEQGIALFDANGQPIGSNISSHVMGWDLGTPADGTIRHAGASDRALTVVITPITEPGPAASLPTIFYDDIALLGANEVPSVTTPASGTAQALLIFDTLIIIGHFDGLQGDLLAVAGSPAHVHQGTRGENGPIVFNLSVAPRSDNRSGSFSGVTILGSDEVADFKSGELYINIHSTYRPSGELRGQLSIEQPEGAVFTLGNAADDNEVITSVRWSDGRLFGKQVFATGGEGSGDGLNGTSNPLILTDDNRYLFAVNGGSDQVSAFSVHNLTNLSLINVARSGGERPISVATHGDLVYVLNAGREGRPGNISGFRLGHNGALTPLSDSTRPLGQGAVDTSQILFSPNGKLLVVTDKATNTITTYRVRSNGRPGQPQVQSSAGETPFGFAFDNRGRLFVTEAFGGREDESALSSYRISGEGTLRVISATVPTTETAACWVRVTDNGRYAYVTNTGSSTVSGYRIASNGALELLDADGVTVETGAGPLDLDIVGSEFLYVHSGGSRNLASYVIEEGTGALTSLMSTLGDLPENTVGVAAY